MIESGVIAIVLLTGSSVLILSSKKLSSKGFMKTGKPVSMGKEEPASFRVLCIALAGFVGSILT